MDNEELKAACVMAGLDSQNEVFNYRNKALQSYVASLLVSKVDKDHSAAIRYQDAVRRKPGGGIFMTDEQRIRAAMKALGDE